MVKGSSIFLKTALFVLPIYLIFLLDDHYNFDDHGVFQIIEDRKKFVRESNDINAIIIGGSNALWGISASQLSALSKENSFYNLSMHSNGVNYINYFEYILDTLKPVNNEEIELIIWSTIHTYLEPPYNDFDRDIAGRLRLSKLVPNQSLLSKLYKSIVNQESLYFKVNGEFGDFLFDDFKCPLSDPRYLNKDLIKTVSNESYKFAPIQPLKNQIEIYQDFFKKNFPNAKVIFTVPSVINPPDISQDELSFLREIFGKKNQYLFVQKPIKDINFLCESSHHPNQTGREIRTREIYEFLKQNNL